MFLPLLLCLYDLNDYSPLDSEQGEGWQVPLGRTGRVPPISGLLRLVFSHLYSMISVFVFDNYLCSQPPSEEGEGSSSMDMERMMTPPYQSWSRAEQ